MYDKSYYRTSLNEYSKYLKLTNFCTDCNISLSNFSKFMKGYDDMLSIQKLDILCGYISQYCKKIEL